ncbi:putative disease resistance protein RGA3 [Prosopis cineraria]|uniref:putative disease resistance protein RGA3 n=1 Tax=Prosopis cineraria TaxID=364024 RepID=UPI00240F8322|nr:putative disease resistance protein RGA3 [Prosopis cineraria]
MAEQVPYSVVASLIYELGSSTFREFVRVLGVQDELNKLKDTIESIKAVLLDAEEKQEQNREVKNWVGRLKKVLHNADDLLDDVVIEDLRRKVDNDRGGIGAEVCHFFSSSNSIAFRHKIARKIEKIRQLFKSVAEDMSILKFSHIPAVVKQDESVWRETSSFVLRSEIFGREENKKEIVNLLERTDGNKNVSLIAIVGIGGLGKTALAQLLYNDSEVQRIFQKQIWVCVSHDFQVKTLLNKMLKSLQNCSVGDLELDQLQVKLQESLSGQRYLLVLDDVWSESQQSWNSLRTYLMCGAPGSKILVTTRSQIVAQTMGVDSLYLLEGLSKEESWTLLKKLAFGEDLKRLKQNLVPIGEKIAEKCRGVPLAIRTMGGLLQLKSEESEWLSILDGDFWRLCEDKDSIMPVLKLSYQNLPLELRQCFSYCSLYPKDWEIQKEELVQLWMAQGYLECSTENKCLEDVGNHFVKILLMKSFFQEAKVNKHGDVLCFKMHDLVHDLAVALAGNDCCLHSEEKQSVGTPIHLSFESTQIYLIDSLDASKLRTFLWPTQGLTEFRSINNLSAISNFKCLRTLNLSCCSLSHLPESIGKLKHLRYLDLKFCQKLISLPKTITNLVSLQTLKLHACVKLEFSVEAITRLISLRHLDIRSCKAFKFMMPAGLGKLSSLQYLSTFVVGDDQKRNRGKLNELKDLKNLRGHLTIKNLGLVGDVVLETQEVNLNEKKYLQSLKLDWGDSKNNNDDSLQLLENLGPHQNLKELSVARYPGVGFSGWLSSLTNIVEVSVSGFPNCVHLPPLERLSSLKSLAIEYMSALEHICFEWFEDNSPTSTTLFPSLERLSLILCPNLRGWQGMPQQQDPLLPAFPHISSLTIKNCPNLTCMPTYPCLAENLHLEYSSIKPLVDTLKMNTSASTATEDDPNLPITPLSLLKHLIICDMDMEALPEEWICKLSSLRHFTVDSCPNLESLPEGIDHLINLQTLEITACPLLLERCKRETGPDWPKIAHIPNIRVVR